MKKCLSLMVMVAFTVSLLTGFTTVSTKRVSKDPVKLTFLCNETPTLTKEFWKIPADKYMKLHPEVTIEEIFQPSSNINVRDYAKTLLATGQFPDVMVMTSPGDFVPSGALLAYDDKDLSIVKPEYVSKINGKAYVLPYKIQVGGVFYNKKIFAVNGLKEPKNFNDLVNICKKLDSKKITPIAVGIKEAWAQILTWITLTSADINSINPNLPAQIKAGKATFSGSKEFINAMNDYKLLVTKYTNKDKASMSHTQSLDYFYSGKAGMYVQGSWTQADEAKLKHNFEVGFFSMPSDQNNKTIPIWANEGLAISAKCMNPAIAKDFVKFFMSDKEFVGQFLKSEQLLTATKTAIPYEKTALHKIIEGKMKDYKAYENFYDSVGDNTWLPGVTQLFDKLSMALATNPNANVVNEVRNLDKEYAKIADNAKQ